MANITAKDVAELRAKTGLGMMDCKKALVEAEGDMDKAITILREKGLATAAKKESRIAADGIVKLMNKGDAYAMIEVNSETDFVAKNETFRTFVRGLLETVIATRPANVEELMTKTMGDGKTVEAALQEKTYTIGEKLDIRRFVTVDGTVSTYIHGGGSTGVVVRFEAAEAALANEGFAEFAKNVALQVAAMPAQYVDRTAVPENVLAEERAILEAQMAQDPKMANKPAKVLEGIINGKLGKFFETYCLVDQAYVKDDSMTVGKYVAATAKEFGGDIKIVAFYRFDKGEGIEKREDNLAEEVAKMTGKA